jgi:ACS family hexuronate transporter-like MFS transporter
MSINAARKTVVAVAACMMPFGILAARAHSAHTALACITVVLFGFQMWISNVQTLPSDFFSQASVGAVAGMGGTAAGIASLLFNLSTAPLARHFGYGFVLTIAGLLAPIGLLLLFVVGGNIHRLPLPQARVEPLPA